MNNRILSIGSQFPAFTKKAAVSTEKRQGIYGFKQ